MDCTTIVKIYERIIQSEILNGYYLATYFISLKLHNYSFETKLQKEIDNHEAFKLFYLYFSNLLYLPDNKAEVTIIV